MRPWPSISTRKSLDWDGEDPRRPRSGAYGCASYAPEGSVRGMVVTPMVIGGRTLGWFSWRPAATPAASRALVADVAHRSDRAAGRAGAPSQPPDRAAASRNGARRSSRSATGWRATSTTTWRRGSRPSSCSCRAPSATAARCRPRSRRDRHRYRPRAHASDRSAPFGRRAAPERRQRRRPRDRAQAADRHARSGPRQCRSTRGRRAAALRRRVEREIIGIAQEALTNAVRHARARRITFAPRRCNRSVFACRWPTTAAASRAISRRPASA